MKKLLFKCALLALLVGTILYGGGVAYKQTNAYRNLERTEETDKFHELPNQVDIAVVGSSHGRDSFKCPPEGAVMFNFSMSSQTPQYDLAMLRQFQDQIKPGALVVMTVSPMYPFFVQPEDDFTRRQPRYYRILSPENIVDVDLWYWLRIRYSPLLAVDLPQIAEAFFKSPDPILTVDQKYGTLEFSPEDVPKEQERILRDHIAADITSFPEESHVMMNAYREMLKLCQENDWQAVLVTPPYLTDYVSCYDQYNPHFFAVLARLMDGLCQTYGVEWLDYSHDPVFAERYDLYKNIDHLNLKGAAVFNRQFFADVQSLGL